MDAKINKEGKVEFHISDLIGALDDQSKIEFIESLSCEKAIIQHVMDQVMEGFTLNSYHGDNYDAGPELKSALGLARARITAESVDELRDMEITRLKQCLERETRYKDQYSKWAYSMYHSWGKTPRPPEKDYPTFQ